MRISNQFRKLIYNNLEYDRDKYYLKIYVPVDLDKICLIFNNKKQNGKNYKVFMRKEDDGYHLFNDDLNSLKVFPKFSESIDNLKREFLSFYNFINFFDSSILFHSRNFYYDQIFFKDLPEIQLNGSLPTRLNFNFKFKISKEIEKPYLEFNCEYYMTGRVIENYKRTLINDFIAKKLDIKIEDLKFEDLKIFKILNY